ITLYHGDNEEDATNTRALLDSGAIHNFASLALVDYLRVPVEKFPTNERCVYRLADGSLYTCKAFCAITMRIDGTHHEETVVFRILETCSFPIILGMDWIKRHDPTIKFTTGTMTLNCLTKACIPINEDMQFTGVKRPFRVSPSTITVSSSLISSSPATISTPRTSSPSPLAVTSTSPADAILNNAIATPTISDDEHSASLITALLEQQLVHNTTTDEGWGELSADVVGNSWGVVFQPTLQLEPSNEELQTALFNQFIQERETMEQQNFIEEPYNINTIVVDPQGTEWMQPIFNHYGDNVDDALSIISLTMASWMFW
ncbi:hypothetical protein, partial, partial [Parasitella parasitica]